MWNIGLAALRYPSPQEDVMRDLDNLRRLAEERAETDPLAAMALDGCAEEIERLRGDRARRIRYGRITAAASIITFLMLLMAWLRM